MLSILKNYFISLFYPTTSDRIYALGENSRSIKLKTKPMRFNVYFNDPLSQKSDNTDDVLDFFIEKKNNEYFLNVFWNTTDIRIIEVEVF